MKLEPSKTAMLSLDLQKGILGIAPGCESIMPTATKAVEYARRKNYFLIHVGIGFEHGYPEIPDFESTFSNAKKHGLFLKGTPSTEFDPRLLQPKDLIVYKHRVSAFAQNNLQMILRARGIEHLVFFGLSTSGIVLSTLRAAFDLDFRSIVIVDACYDPDEEVHRVLTTKVFPKQAQVLTLESFMKEQS